MRLVENLWKTQVLTLAGTDGMKGEQNTTWGEEGDHDEASARMDGVTEDCRSARTESVSYTRNNEPHLK